MTSNLVGRSIQQFRVTGLLGAGGMGEVYIGIDEKLGRQVALKCIRAEHRLNLTSRARFLREAQILSQLAHPAICQVLDFGLSRPVTDAGEPPAPHGRCRSVPAQSEAPGADGTGSWASGETLDEPSPRDTGQGLRASSNHLTQVGTVLGTVEYMSPEQARGEDVTVASDIYSFGLVLQELFTGNAPYRQDGPSTLAEGLARAAKGATRPVKGLASDLTALIERMKALPHALRPTAVEVAERLLRQGLELRERSLGPAHPDVGDDLHWLAGTLCRLRRSREADALLEEALAISERVMGPGHPQTRVVLYNLGANAALAGDRDKALRWLEADVQRGEDDPSLATDEDLGSLRGEPRFKALLAVVKRRASG